MTQVLLIGIRINLLFSKIPHGHTGVKAVDDNGEVVVIADFTTD